jgi:hypothetical protein
MVRCEFFPQNEHDQHFKLPLGGLAHRSIAKLVVEQPLFGRSVTRMPRLDKVPYGDICLDWKWEAEIIEELAKAVLRTG